MLAKATASCSGAHRTPAAARSSSCQALAPVPVASLGAGRHAALSNCNVSPALLESTFASPANSFRRFPACSRAARNVTTAARSTSTEPWWTKDNPPNMVEVNGVQEFIDLLAASQDKLVIADFFATWCASCRSLFPKLCKLMAENPDVLFIKVNHEENKQLCRTLGVKVLPFFHFYKGAEGRVEAFSCSVSKVQRFRDALELHSGAFCNLEPFSGLPEFPDIEPHKMEIPIPAAVHSAATEVHNITIDPTATIYETLVSVDNAPGPIPAPVPAVANGAAPNGVALNGAAVNGTAMNGAANGNGVHINGNGSTLVPDAVPLEVLAGWRAAEMQGSSGSNASRQPDQEGQLAAAV